MAHDFIGFYDVEIEERERFFYPPYYKIIQLTLKHVQEEIVHEGAQFLADQLREVFKERVLGPEFPQRNQVENRTRRPWQKSQG